MVINSVEECDKEIRKELYNNIVISGGSTLFEGLPDRLHKEIDALCPRLN